MAAEMPRDALLVVQETEYTGAGKHPIAQLALAREMGIEVERGDPARDEPGRRIVIPEHPAAIAVTEVDLDRVRRSYLANAHRTLGPDERGAALDETDVAFLAADTRTCAAYVRRVMEELDEAGG